MSTAVDFAMVEALRDMGMSDAEVAAELGCEIMALRPSVPPPAPIARTKWTRELVSAALLLWREEKGHLPTTALLKKNTDPRFPGPGQVASAFGSFAGAMRQTFGVTYGVQDEESAHTKLQHTLIGWSARDGRLSEFVDRFTVGAGRIAPVKVQGRQVSNAGLVRMLAERMAVIRLHVELIDAKERDQQTIVQLAALAVAALDDLERMA